nr:hypothetical protein [Tanacetum cinerariifolium]
KENEKLLVDSVLNRPIKYGIVTEGGTAITPAIVRDRRYDELIVAEKLRKACDIKATNIVLQGLPQDTYNMGDKIKGMQAVVLEIMLQLQGLTKLEELTQQVIQRLFTATAVKRKATWQDSVPNLKGLGIHHDLKEIPRELPVISLVKDSYNKMKSHVNDFENVVTIHTKVTGQNEGSWGFEHIQKDVDKDVKPFVKILKEYFHMFDQGLHKEITDMKEVFTKIETEGVKCSVKRKTFEIKEKELLLENDRLFELLLSQDLMHTAVNSLAEIIDYQSMEKSFLDE